MTDKERKDYLKHNAIVICIFLGIILLGIIAYKFITKAREPKYPDWGNPEYGDIVVTIEDKEEEIIPENIFDAYGLEYEFVKLPSVGISTYKPVGWEMIYENDFFYFLSPDDDEKYPHMEVAICVMNIGNIDNTYDRMHAQNYVHTNVKNHNVTLLQSMLVTNNAYVPIKDGGDIFAYYSTPNINFSKEGDPLKGGWNPYTVIYMLNTDTDVTTFCCITGPRNYVMEIEEVAKTTAYNTMKYKNSQFDLNELMHVNMKKASLNKMSFMVKDMDDVALNGGTDNTSYGTADFAKYSLSNDYTSLAFNCNLVVISQYCESGVDSYTNETFMEYLYQSTCDIYRKSRQDFERQNIEKPKFVIDSIEKYELYNKDARKVVWHVEMPEDSSGRTRVDSIMPKMFTSYLIPDGTTIYSFTINYTRYQKYAALQYLEKTLQTAGLSSK